MNKKAMALLLIGALLLTVFAAGCSSKKAEYPSRQIEFDVPFAAGGVTDLVARAAADYLSKEWKQPVVVVNKPGGIVTASESLQAKPDGYTVTVITTGEMAASIAAAVKPPINPDEVTYIGRLSKFPLGFIVAADAPWKDFKEFSDWAVKNPEKLTYGSTSMTASATFAIADWMKVIGADFKKARLVVSTGAADGATKIAGGHITVMAGDILGSKSLIEAGKLKALAVSPYQHPYFPNIPVAEEAGVKGMSCSNGVGLLMPKGTPADLVKKWDDTLAKMFKDQAFLDSLKKIGAIDGYMNSADYSKFTKDEIARYTKLAEEIGVRK